MGRRLRSKRRVLSRVKTPLKIENDEEDQKKKLGVRAGRKKETPGKQN